MAIDQGFGIDTSVLSGDDQDLDDTFAEVSDVTVLQEDIYKCVTTPSAPVVFVDGQGPFQLLFWEDPPVSQDLRDRLNDSITDGDRARIASRIEAAYANDLRFHALAASVTLSRGSPGGTLNVDINGQASGQLLSMSLVVGTNGITVDKAA